VLEKTPLEDAVAEMNRYEDEKLIIDSPDIGKLRISGIYHVGDSVGFAQTIAKLLSVAGQGGRSSDPPHGNAPVDSEPLPRRKNTLPFWVDV